MCYFIRTMSSARRGELRKKAEDELHDKDGHL